MPVFNAQRTIGDCIKSLSNSLYPNNRFEIIVVDNGSRDKTRDIINNYDVNCFYESRRGIPFARNRGFMESRGEIIAYTDSDCIVSRNWLRELSRSFMDLNPDAVEGETLDYPAKTKVEKYIARRRAFSYEMRQYSPLTPYFITANVAFKRHVFEKIGLFDTRFEGGSDVDFSWRFFNEHGFKNVYNPNAVVLHRHRIDLCGFFSQNYRVGKGLAMLQNKYPRRLPWGFKKEINAWIVLFSKVFKALRFSITVRYPNEHDNASDYYLDFLRRFAVRTGYILQKIKL